MIPVYDGGCTMRNPDAHLRDDVREAIDRAFPEGVVEMAFDSDESYFWDVHPELGGGDRAPQRRTAGA
jgi:hypothetical protein